MADASEAILKAQAAGEAAQQASASIGTNGQKAGVALPTIKATNYAPKTTSSGGSSGSRVLAAAGRTAQYLTDSSAQTMSGYVRGQAANSDFYDLATSKPDLYPNLAAANQVADHPQTFWDKVKTTLASPLSAVSKVLNVVSNVAYGTASEILNPIAAGISTGISKATGDTRSAGDLYGSALKTGLDTSKKFYSGDRASDIIIGQSSPTFLQDHTGVSLGLSVAESLLDPTNYLSFGFGKGATIINEAGKVVHLTEDASTFAKSLNKTIEEITPQIKKAIENGTALKVGDKTLAASSIVDKSAIRFGGTAIKGTEKAMEAIQAAKMATVQVMHEIPGFNKVADALSSAFVSSVDKIGNAKAAQIAREYKAQVSSALARNDQTAYDLTKSLSKEEQKLILENTTSAGRAAVIASLSPEGQVAAQKIYQALDELTPLERAAKIPVEDIPDYMPQRYKNSYEEITQKLTDTKVRLAKMVKSGEALNPVQQELHQLFQASGDLKRLEGQPYFVNDKFLKTKAMADEAGLTTNGSLRDVLRSRFDASTEAISKNNLATTLDKEFVQPSLQVQRTLQGKIDALRASVKGQSKKEFDAYLKDYAASGRRFSEQSVTDELNRVAAKAQANFEIDAAHMTREAYGDTEVVSRKLNIDGVPTDVTLPKELDGIIDKTYGAISADGKDLNVPSWLKKPIAVYDKGAQMWKGAVTSLYPNFYIRNAMDSTFRNVQDIGLWNTLKPAAIRDSYAIAKLSDKAAIDEFGKAIVNYGGKDYTLAALRKMMDEAGVTQSLRAAEGIGGGIRKAGDKIENFSRIQNFLMNLDKTGSVKTAAERSKHFQFDYSDLTPFERGVMQRFFPFYTFNRKNIDFQVSQFLSNPGPYKQLLQIRDSMDKRMNVDESQAPDYIRTGYSLPLGRDADGNMRYLGGLGLSLEGADKTLGAFSSLAAGNTRPFEQNIVSSLNPALKSALEIATGRNFFTGTNFEDPRASDAKNQQAALYMMDKFAPNFVNFTKATRTNAAGQTIESTTANPIAISIASALPTSRATSIGSTAMREDKSVSDVIGGLFSPAKVYSVAPDYADTQAYFDKQDQQKAQLKDFINKGLVKQAQSGRYYVDRTWKTSDQAETDRLRAAALALVNPQ